MTVSETWIEPSTLDLADGDTVEESHYDAILSALLFLGRIPNPSLTNKSGGALAAGDVVIIDASNDSAVTTTTTAAKIQMVGVAMESILNNAAGRIAFAGKVSVKVTGTVNRGEFLETSTVAGSAISVGTGKTQNSFAMALTASSGGYCTALILPAAVGRDIRFARATADQTVANNTLTASTYLTISIGANENWLFVILPKITTSNTTPGGQMALDVPTSATLLAVGLMQNSWGSTTTDAAAFVTQTTGSLVGGAFGFAVVLNGANAGSVTLQFAQSTTSGGNPITLATNSIMVGIRIS